MKNLWKITLVCLVLVMSVPFLGKAHAEYNDCVIKFAMESTTTDSIQASVVSSLSDKEIGAGTLTINVNNENGVVESSYTSSDVASGIISKSFPNPNSNLAITPRNFIFYASANVFLKTISTGVQDTQETQCKAEQNFNQPEDIASGATITPQYTQNTSDSSLDFTAGADSTQKEAVSPSLVKNIIAFFSGDQSLSCEGKNGLLWLLIIILSLIIIYLKTRQYSDRKKNTAIPQPPRSSNTPR